MFQAWCFAPRERLARFALNLLGRDVEAPVLEGLWRLGSGRSRSTASGADGVAQCHQCRRGGAECGDEELDDEGRRREAGSDGAERRAVKSDIETGIYPFRDENGGIKLTRADMEWLLATHDAREPRASSDGLTLLSASMPDGSVWMRYRPAVRGTDLSGGKPGISAVRLSSL